MQNNLKTGMHMHSDPKMRIRLQVFWSIVAITYFSTVICLRVSASFFLTSTYNRLLVQRLKFLVDLISLHHLEYRECDISKHELLDADEIFCSSSTNPVVPITQVNDKIISESAGSISLDLYKHSQDYLKDSYK